MVNRLLEGIKYDLRFIGTHTVQPQWYKVLKSFLLVGFLVGSFLWFGWKATVTFFARFFFLCFLVHMLYRVKTEHFTRTWLDFVVVEENGQPWPKSFGKFYYSAVAFNALLSLLISRALS